MSCRSVWSPWRVPNQPRPHFVERKGKEKRKRGGEGRGGRKEGERREGGRGKERKELCITKEKLFL